MTALLMLAAAVGAPVTDRQLGIIQHSLGVDRYGRGRQYRNHFVAGAAEAPDCRRLVELGFMVEHGGTPLSDGCPVFSVTREGRAAMYRYSPKPPKLTRSQRRYRRYLDADGGLTFREWLGTEGAR